jgi:hypothetical protein
VFLLVLSRLAHVHEVVILGIMLIQEGTDLLGGHGRDGTKMIK